ncbi:MAG TPA: MGMT family protein [Candidatus Dormibacteraeota bacterium]
MLETRSEHQLRIEAILAQVRAISPGSVRSYGEIDPEAPRLVGRVLATTDQDVPWQRVIYADGRIPKGEGQRELLRKEGVPMRGARVDLYRTRILSRIAPAVASFLRAAQAADAKAVVSAFAKDARLTDGGRTWRGRTEIRRWWSGPANLHQGTLDLLAAHHVTTNRWVVTVRPHGGTTDLRYRFTIRDGAITSLTIAP